MIKSVLNIFHRLRDAGSALYVTFLAKQALVPVQRGIQAGKTYAARRFSKARRRDNPSEP